MSLSKILSHGVWAGIGAIASIIALFLANQMGYDFSFVKNQELNNNTDTGDINTRIEQFQTQFIIGVNSEFTDQSTQKQVLKDEIIDILLKSLSIENITEEEVEIQSLGEELGSLIQETPISSYQLIEPEFTIPKDKAHFLPGDLNSISVDGNYLGVPGSLALKLNGRDKNMEVGHRLVVEQDEQDCNLLLHEIAESYEAATFSFICPNQ